MTTERPRWHAALAYALLGPPLRSLDEPGRPVIPLLVADLSAEAGGVDELRAAVARARSSRPWPYLVPTDLRAGLGPAQYAAAWTTLLVVLGPAMPNEGSVLRDRALTADERRLLADRPPHHGD